MKQLIIPAEQPEQQVQHMNQIIMHSFTAAAGLQLRAVFDRLTMADTAGFG
ncbi:hypothetical protein D3C80_2219590 [compost metagenome]